MFNKKLAEEIVERLFSEENSNKLTDLLINKNIEDAQDWFISEIYRLDEQIFMEKVTEPPRSDRYA